jgi:hypothetical protein
MKKAFFINGGAGRVLCSIPALEEYAKNNDDFIIVAESWGEFYQCSRVLRDKAYPVNHKDLFELYLRDKEIVSPEPYRLNAYFNQKCNLIQAFDMLINDLDEIPKTKKITIELNKSEQITGHNILSEIRETLKKDKAVVFQPFGSSVKIEGNFIVDVTGRSFELANIYQIIEELRKNYAVILMSQIPLPGSENLGIATPQNLSLTQWAGVINSADYFLGCDSVGQHIAYAMDKPATVVVGSTYPENISYPNEKNFKIIDNGKDKRTYSPIRMTFCECSDRNNEELMVLNENRIKDIVKSIRDKIGISKVTNESLNLSGSGSNAKGSILNGGSTQNKGILSTPKEKSSKNGKSTIDKILELNNITN